MTEARAIKLIVTEVIISYFELTNARSEVNANLYVLMKLREAGIPIVLESLTAIPPKLVGVERGTLTKKNDDARLIFTWTHEADA
jgi:hypothetical protein